MSDFTSNGAFTSLPVYRIPLWLDFHLERLNETLAALGILRVISAEAILHQLAAQNIQDLAVRIEATADSVNLVTRSLPVIPTAGYRLMCAPHPVAAPFANWKVLDRTAYAQVKETAVATGFHDALLLDQSGEVLETAVANIFIISDQHLVTAPLHGQVLPGIVRRFILKQFDVEVRPFDLAELLAAEEVFITNSLIGIQPVAQVDQHVLTPRRQPITEKVIQAYQEVLLTVK